MLRILVCCTVLLVLLFAGCRSAEMQPPEVPAPPLGRDEGPPPEDIVSDLGTVRYIDLEGGFYGIETEGGARYNPLNLADSLKEDGITVRFRAVTRDDVVTIQMWGTPVELLEVARVTVGEY